MYLGRILQVPTGSLYHAVSVAYRVSQTRISIAHQYVLVRILLY